MARQNIVKTWKEKAQRLDQLEAVFDWSNVYNLMEKGLAFDFIFKHGLNQTLIIDFDFGLSEEFTGPEEVLEYYRKMTKGDE